VRIEVTLARIGATLALASAVGGATAGAAPAEPVSGPHETIDNRLTTTQRDAPSGFSFDGSYHAAGDPSANPPYMRRMVFYPSPGLRYDTSVPDRCTASDLELAIRGAAACPAGSRLGGGTSTTAFMGQFPSTLAIDFLNNANEQIILAHSPLLATVARGHINPDGSIEFASPTCFPAVQPVGCPLDTVLQLRSTIAVAPYTRAVDGVVRSYLTTPPTCPAGGSWEQPVRLWWADGSVDTVVTRQPCAQ
jgi:hypothetical protein